MVVVDEIQKLRPRRRDDGPEGRRAPPCPAEPARDTGAKRSGRARCRRCSTAVRSPTITSAVRDIARPAQESGHDRTRIEVRRRSHLRRPRNARPTPAARRANASGALRPARRIRQDARSGRTSSREGGMRVVGGGRRRTISAYDVSSISRVRRPLFASDTRRTSPSASPETSTSIVVVSDAVAADELRVVLAEHDFFVIRLAACRLSARRPKWPLCLSRR